MTTLESSAEGMGFSFLGTSQVPQRQQVASFRTCVRSHKQPSLIGVRRRWLLPDKPARGPSLRSAKKMSGLPPVSAREQEAVEVRKEPRLGFLRFLLSKDSFWRVASRRRRCGRFLLRTWIVGGRKKTRRRRRQIACARECVCASRTKKPSCMAGKMPAFADAITTIGRERLARRVGRARSLAVQD